MMLQGQADPFRRLPMRGDNLIARLTGSPQKFVRRLSDEHGICITSVWRLLHKRKMKPYIPRLVYIKNSY